MAKTVLVVDDNADLRYSVITGLKSVSANVDLIEADGGKKAVQIIKSKKIDLVLLDIMMPDMDGWEVAAIIKADPILKKTPIIFLTAKTDDLSKGMGKITADDYVEKPFEISDLKKRMDKVLSKAK